MLTSMPFVQASQASSADSEGMLSMSSPHFINISASSSEKSSKSVLLCDNVLSFRLGSSVLAGASEGGVGGAL